LSDRLESLKNEILETIEGLSNSDLDDFVRRDELDDYLRKDDYVPGIAELDDSDYDAIAERVKLTWQII
jgi:hypothetical protein